MSDINERIKSVRMKEGSTISGFSLEVGEKSDRLSNMERGKQRVTSEILTALVEQKNVNPLWLLTGQGEMYAKQEEQGAYAFKEDRAIYSQKELITNQRQARINAFVEHWFETMPEDEQAWLEMHLKRNIPEYEHFITDKTTGSKSEKKQA